IDTQGAAPGVADCEQGLVCLEGPELFFSLCNLRMLSQHANDGRVEVALEQGNQLVAHAIARVLELPIAGIFPPGLADGLQVSGDLTPRDGQQGTNDAACALLRLPLLRLHLRRDVACYVSACYVCFCWRSCLPNA